MRNRQDPQDLYAVESLFATFAFLAAMAALATTAAALVRGRSWVWPLVWLLIFASCRGVWRRHSRLQQFEQFARAREAAGASMEQVRAEWAEVLAGKWVPPEASQ